MAAPATINEFLDLIRKSGVLDEKRLDAYLEKLRTSGDLPTDPVKLAQQLVQGGILTHFQAENILQGKWRRFTIGKYKVLERLGAGGMGTVYLCEHKLMRRRVAVKVLPDAKASDSSSLERFYREARAVAALDHPNIVHAYDIDQDETLHFLVMEYVDGASMQDIVKKAGPMDPIRAAHYIRQAAQGLEHARHAGLVHRDIKPGNVLVDRNGLVKVLDMGLARFFNDDDDNLTKKYDENVLGTADYLAPEQAVDSHSVDSRADIYSLGATFYYLLSGRTPFGEGTVAQKLIWHQSRQPKPLPSLRADVPAGLAAIIEKMMAKEPAQRYQTPAEVVEVLAPWTQTPIGPPPETEMPRLSLAATGVAPAEPTRVTSSQPPSPPPGPCKPWQVLAPAVGSGKTPVTPTATATPPPLPVAPPALPTPAKPRPAPRPPSETPTPPRHNAATATPAPTAAAPAAPAPAPPARAPDVNNGPTVPPAKSAATTQQEEAISWENVITAPGDLSIIGAAASPRPTRKSPPTRSAGRATPAGTERERRRNWGVVLVVSALLLVVLGVGLFLVFLRKASDTSSLERKPLQVTRDANISPFRTIQQALREAQAGDVIELLDEHHEENLRVDPSKGATRVTLQAQAGRSLVWTGRKGKEKDPLVRCSNAVGFRFKGKGITLNGQGQTPQLIFLEGECPALTIEDVQLQGFRDSAIQVMNCTGTKEQPVRILDVTVRAEGKEKAPRAAIFFDAIDKMTPQFDDHISIGDGCQFLGLDPQRAILRRDNVVVGDHIRLPAGYNWPPDVPMKLVPDKK